MNVAALKTADKLHDVVVMAEVMQEATYVSHHPKKIALILSAMRKFSALLKANGWKVAYSRLEDADNTQSILGELIRYAERYEASSVNRD